MLRAHSSQRYGTPGPAGSRGQMRSKKAPVKQRCCSAVMAGASSGVAGLTSMMDMSEEMFRRNNA